MKRRLKPLESIYVPRPRTGKTYSIRLLGQEYSFQGLSSLLAAADISKAGDRHAGLAAPSEVWREAARCILSDLTLDHIYHNPLADDRGEIDAVMRINYDIDLDAFGRISHLSLGEFKNLLLSLPDRQAAEAGQALTGVMAAALAKICDIHELIYLARKMPKSACARTEIGLPGTLSSRLQPNHPTDDHTGISLLVYWGLSLGMGDAIWGINPAVDTVENVSSLLRLLDSLRCQSDVPTQICVLGHIKTQLAALERGAKVEILFQSLAGTESTCTAEFDLSIDLLDHGYNAMAERGALAGGARQWMYFETGQGSEFSYGRHNGIDMTTTEALCYGLARRYDPFMVNNVTGFIGPETHLDGYEMVVSNLQDHFMGKLLGLPMGMAPCYTLHARSSFESQQMATSLLAAAGANYYMDVALGTDRMLAYFDTSGHDVQTLRETYGRRPAREFAAWALSRGIFVEADTPEGLARGPSWGDLKPFIPGKTQMQRFLDSLPPPHGFNTAGPRADNSTIRTVRLHQALARTAVHTPLMTLQLMGELNLRSIETEADTHDRHLEDPHAGTRLTRQSLAQLKSEPYDVQILISDGLSASAVHHNIKDLLTVLSDGFSAYGVQTGQPLIARHGRVKLAEAVADALDARLVIHLIGERPGGDAYASRSLSAYLVYRARPAGGNDGYTVDNRTHSSRFEVTVISNIHERGLPPAEAGAIIVDKSMATLQHGAAGNRLERIILGET
ncbi:MAG: ethanolamine ammonia-lyase [Oligoflexales bacterium]|nr:ethanolamine ammonia-lyase [Oligoflexales bacterium]